VHDRALEPADESGYEFADRGHFALCRGLSTVLRRRRRRVLDIIPSSGVKPMDDKVDEMTYVRSATGCSSRCL